MELHQEAGFAPLKVIQHATQNNARILGQENRLGCVRAGFAADLLIVDGNPLQNLKLLYSTRADEIRNGKTAHGGVEWNIKDGIPYHAPALAADIREIVRRAITEIDQKKRYFRH